MAYIWHLELPVNKHCTRSAVVVADYAVSARNLADEDIGGGWLTASATCLGEAADEVRPGVICHGQ